MSPCDQASRGDEQQAMLSEDSPQGDAPFSAVLSRALSAAQAHHSQLSDGQLSLAYEALHDHFATLDERFAAQGVLPGEVVVLECTTAVPGALTLLYLLSRG